MVYIDTPAAADSSQIITLAGKSYIIWLRWFDREDSKYWVLDLSDARTRTSIITGQKITDGEFLVNKKLHTALGGLMFVTGVHKDNITRDNFGIGKEFTLVFATIQEYNNVISVRSQV